MPTNRLVSGTVMPRPAGWATVCGPYTTIGNSTARVPAVPNAAQTEDTWRAQEKRYAEVGGDLALKAFHLEEGERWWLRGRFGRGPLDRGVAKALPGGRVRHTEQALLYYPLLMPNPIPRPPDPLKNPLKVPIPRRHMEYWQSDSILESTVPAGYVANQADPNVPQAILRPAQVRQLVAALDCNSTGVRLVGFLEYQMALRHFEMLLGMTTGGERQAIDEMGAQDDRFAVHSALSRQYDDFARSSVLPLRLAKTEDPRAQGEYERPRSCMDHGSGPARTGRDDGCQDSGPDVRATQV